MVHNFRVIHGQDDDLTVYVVGPLADVQTGFLGCSMMLVASPDGDRSAVFLAHAYTSSLREVLHGVIGMNVEHR